MYLTTFLYASITSRIDMIYIFEGVFLYTFCVIRFFFVT